MPRCMSLAGLGVVADVCHTDRARMGMFAIICAYDVLPIRGMTGTTSNLRQSSSFLKCEACQLNEQWTILRSKLSRIISKLFPLVRPISFAFDRSAAVWELLLNPPCLLLFHSLVQMRSKRLSCDESA